MAIPLVVLMMALRALMPTMYLTLGLNPTGLLMTALPVFSGLCHTVSPAAAATALAPHRHHLHRPRSSSIAHRAWPLLVNTDLPLRVSRTTALTAVPTQTTNPITRLTNRLTKGLLKGLLTGLLTSLPMSLLTSLPMNLPMGLPMGLPRGLPTSLLTSLSIGLPMDLPTSMAPMALWRTVST